MIWLKQRLLVLALTPAALAAVLTPPLQQPGPGGHPVEVVARDLTEGGPVGRSPSRHGDPGLERAALHILGSERRSGALAQALGAVRLTAVQIGNLNARGRRLGATMLVDLAEPRRDLWATVPSYVPVEGGSGTPYTPQTVRMHAAVLRDALIDIDVGRRRVIAFEPGPRSRSLSWSPSPASAVASYQNQASVCGLRWG
jgi:hypothetical protein